MPPLHSYRTSLELAKSWYTLSKKAQDAFIEKWKAKTTVEKCAIALLIPGYMQREMPHEKRKLVNRPSQAAPVEETPESIVEKVELATQRRGSSRDPRRGQQAQSQAAPATQRRG